MMNRNEFIIVVIATSIKMNTFFLFSPLSLNIILDVFNSNKN